MSTPDIASAARRVAEAFRPFHATTIGGTHVMVQTADLVALLPILDAVAAMPEPEARVERWARSLDASLWTELDKAPRERKFIGLGAEAASLKRARAAIALADAERMIAS